jgi:hypothetical protein
MHISGNEVAYRCNERLEMCVNVCVFMLSCVGKNTEVYLCVCVCVRETPVCISNVYAYASMCMPVQVDESPR